MLKLVIQQIKDNTMSSTNFNPNGPSVLLGSASAEEKTLFLDALPTNTTTKHLHVGYSTYSTDNAEKLATALKLNTTLTSLSLYGACPGEARTATIIGALVLNSTLTSLYASSSTCVSRLVAQRIGSILEGNSTLQKLFLGNCNMEDQEAIALTRTLGINSALVTLDLSHNKISAEGALEISKVLSSNSTLTEMNFSNNRLAGNKGAYALIDAALLHPSLTYLNLSYMGITAVSIPKIVELIHSTSSLRTLDVRSSERVDTTLTEIRDAILLNETITAFYVIPPNVSFITDDSRAIDTVCLRNKHNMGQKAVSLFELLRDHLIKIAPEENLPIPQQELPEVNFINPHRDSFK